MPNSQACSQVRKLSIIVFVFQRAIKVQRCSVLYMSDGGRSATAIESYITLNLIIYTHICIHAYTHTHIYTRTHTYIHFVILISPSLGGINSLILC